MINRHMSLLNKGDISYLEDMLFDEMGRLKVLPYNELKDIKQEHISQFCLSNGIYSLPTQEMIDLLNEEIGDKRDNTIEIGSGNGVYARTLHVMGVDNFMQTMSNVKEYYEAANQPTVKYGANVIKLEALEAVKKYKPDIVFGAFCTHKYNPNEHWRGGNMFGINEKTMLNKIKKYIHIGNKKIHDKKPILKLKHREIKESWIMSRSLHKNDNVIWIWE